MKSYKVRLSGDGIVTAVATIAAQDEREAKHKAKKLDFNQLEWELSSLHEDPYVYDVTLDTPDEAK